MYFVKLTTGLDEEIFVNLELVTDIFEIGGRSKIVFSKEDYITVKESPDQIFNKPEQSAQ